jgi:serine/threonine protein kinase
VIDVRDASVAHAAVSLANGCTHDGREAARLGAETSNTLENLYDLARIAEAHRRARDREEPVIARTPVAARTRVWGAFELLEPLGGGSSAEVFRAWDRSLHREVALKLRRAEGHSRAGARAWIAEARRLARVRHPNVVTVLGVAVHRGRPGLWTELIEGETLESRLAREGRFDEREAAVVGLDLCRALAAVHGAGLVHGDLKAANVMRESGTARCPGRIVLMDFGSGRERGSSGTPVSGTPLATAPEVLAGGEPTVRSDLYALGALLHRLLSGEHPYPAQTLAELRATQAADPPPSLRATRNDVSTEMARVVRRALATDPARRYPDAAAMEAALDDTLALRLRGAHVATEGGHWHPLRSRSRSRWRGEA